MKVHDDSRGFNCDVCLKMFISNSQLQRHYRIHTGKKPFVCQICDNKFTNKSNLARHQVTHSEIRSFKCSICPEGRFFKTKKELNQHMVFHYKPKFSCIHCDHKSYTKHNLKQHAKTHNKK